MEPADKNKTTKESASEVEPSSSDRKLSPTSDTGRYATTLENFIKLAGILLGLSTSIYSAANEKPGILILGLVVLFVVLASHWYLEKRRRQQSPKPIIQAKGGAGAFLRGLLPFEEGEPLLGRDEYTKGLVTKLTSSDFQFGYLSGEAGVGKTSLLRSGLVPKLKSSRTGVVYVKRTGDNPRDALSRELSRQFGASFVLDASDDLKSMSSQAARRVMVDGCRRLIIIFDQFEEFFITNPSRTARERFSKELFECLSQEGIQIGALLSLRKEFVDDLQEFSPAIEQPLDNRYSTRLLSFDRDTALAVLSKAAESDGVRFSEDLKSLVIDDLMRDGKVLPVEVQVVATRLAFEGFFDIEAYKRAGRARGLIASFIRESISPRVPDQPDLDKQIARLTLRLLCGSIPHVRSPKGLTLAEIVSQVQTALSAASPPQQVSANDLQVRVAQLLGQCVKQYLVILEDEHTYNLANDYVVTAIRDATADITPPEERANTLLAEYLEEQKRGRSPVLSWKMKQFLEKHTSPHLRGQPGAASLFRRARMRMAAKVIAIAIVLLGVPTVLLPIGTVLETKDEAIENRRWILSRDRRLAIAFRAGETSYAWWVDRDWETKKDIPISFEAMVPSPKSSYMAGITRDGNVYLWPSNRDLVQNESAAMKVTPLSSGLDPHNYGWAGFSPDEKWFYVTSPDGALYLWNPAAPPGGGLEPTIDRGDSDASLGSGRLRLIFSPKATWVLVLYPGGKIAVSRPDQLRGGKPRIILDLGESSRFSPERHVKFSPDERLIAGVNSSGELYLIKVDEVVEEGVKTTNAKSVGLPGTGTCAFAFSLDNNWLIARRTFQSFFAINTSGVWKQSALTPAIDLPRSDGDNPGYGGIAFSPDHKWVAGMAQDGGVYLWELNAPPGRAAVPSTPPERKSAAPITRFSPSGKVVAVKGTYGKVYVWTIGQKPDLSRPVARHDAFSLGDLLFSDDGHSLYTYGGNLLFWGDHRKPLQEIVRHPTLINRLALSNDRTKLVVIGSEYLTIVRRRWHFWGIPIHAKTWPLFKYEE